MDQQKSKEKQYIIRQKIGQGAFGQVEKCTHKQSGKVLAVKTMQVSRLYVDTIQEEATVMKNVDSQYILELFDNFYDDSIGSYILVTPYYKLGSFQHLINKEWNFDDLMLFFYQIAKALEELFEKSICHMDLKPQNILIKSDGQYVLCDFGCSRQISKKNMQSFNALKVSVNSKGGGTTEYAAPELVVEGLMSQSVDIWSLGIILYKMIYKKHPLMKHSFGYEMLLSRFEQGKVNIQFPENEEFDKILPLLKEMLGTYKQRNKMKIRWTQIVEEIQQILQIKEEIRDFIVTDFDSLLYFVDNSSIVLSGVMHYLSQNRDFLRNNEIEYLKLVKDSCIYLQTLIKESISHTNEAPQKYCQFYLFKSTRSHITKKQKQYASYLQDQISSLCKQNNISTQYGNIQLLRETILNQLGQFYKRIKKISTLPTSRIKQSQIEMLKEILNFVAFDNKLEFRNKKKLNDFCKEIINY